MSLLSDSAAELLGELDVYIVRAGLAIDQRALRVLDDLADLHKDWESELNRLLGLHEEYLGTEGSGL